MVYVITQIKLSPMRKSIVLARCRLLFYLNSYLLLFTVYAHKNTRCGERNWAGEKSFSCPERASTVITVCTLLHNHCKQSNIPQPDDDGDKDEVDHDAEFGRVEQNGRLIFKGFTHGRPVAQW